MANLKAIRRRIGSIHNTQKITRAMKMVAAARLRRSQEAVQAFRPYADTISSMLAEVAGEDTELTHPLLEERKEKKSLVVAFSSDKGLCGGFNSNLCRSISNHVVDSEIDISLEIIGRKANEFFVRRPLITIDKYIPDVYDDISYGTAAKIARELAARYASGEFDSIDLYFNRFVSMISQTPTVKRLLPLIVPAKEDNLPEGEAFTGEAGPVGFLFEPSSQKLLGDLLPRYVEVQVFRALLESVAGEHAARMTAMDAATNNAEEMLGQLTLEYNRARQSAITSELMDIVGGAEALSE